MIRDARSADAFDIANLLSELHCDTIYNGLSLDPVRSRRLFAQMVQRHGGSHEGASCLFVQDRKGEIRGFIAGMLDRVYHVGESLWATDVFIHVCKGEPVSTLHSLVAAYIEWAEENDTVFEVRLSTSYATPNGRRMGDFYQRLGFEECGKIYRRLNLNYVAEERSEDT